MTVQTAVVVKAREYPLERSFLSVISARYIGAVLELFSWQPVDRFDRRFGVFRSFVASMVVKIRESHFGAI